MSGGAGGHIPACAKCGKRAALIQNRLIGGWFCKPCDRYITCPSPDLERKYNERVAARKKAETP